MSAVEDTATSAAAAQQEIERVFALQREHRWKAKNSDAAHRKAMLTRLKESVIAHADDARDALYADLGKPPEEPMMAEVMTVLGDIEEALAHLEEWMAPVDLDPTPGRLISEGSKARIQYEGRGVVLLFGPWNFPYQLVLAPLVPIIAAGNTAIVKPNEMAPATSALLAKIIGETFEEHEVAVFEGGVDLANALLELPIDHVFFTGSPKVATTVMQAAATHLASVTLELGGKCPAIIDETTDLEAAAGQVAFGKHYNSGQICLSPDHVWVKQELRDAFVEHYLEWIQRNLYTADGELNRGATAKMVDGRNLARVKAYVDDAITRGATVAGPAAVHADEERIEPTVLLDVPLDADVMRDEIFGPVLPVLTFNDVDDIASYLQSGGKPLAMYIFSDDETFVRTLLERTSSGGVTVNGWALHHSEPKLPFGGIGTSGSGRYHGHHGFKELSHERSVVVQPAIWPPY